MAFLTAAAIEIGKAVAKSIFKFWLKDSALGQDISSSLIDLVESRTSDALAQRKGARQFEDIGDKITEDLLPFLKSEGIHLDEGERKAVALAVAETLNTSRLSQDILLEHNLQPPQLAQYLLASSPKATRDFSEAGSFLYQRLIQECCTYIVDITSRLPSFTEHTFAEMLKRDDLIIAKVNQALDELHKIREHLDPTHDVDRFEIAYRDAVARNLDVLQLIGADVSLPNRRHKLSVAYISLSVAPTFASFAPDANPSSASPQDEPVREGVSVDTVLASPRRLLIRGLAGSGKTTLLQWIAVRAATRSFEGQLTSWNGSVPFYIRLRHYTQRRLPKPEEFPEFAAPAIIGTMPTRWAHHILESGRAIILVDGVDEVSASQREEVHTWLRDLVETYPDTHFIVTSRPHAIEEGWMNHEAFSDAMLQDMEIDDIFSFIDHWHEAVGQELLSDEEKNELAPLVEHLKKQVRQVRAIRTLATNPLLCAMLCALNRERRRQLPVNRIELYKACCSLLLERREKESRIDLSDYPALNYGQKQRLLEDLAYWMIKESLSEVETPVVDERFARKLANMPNIPQDTSGTAVRRLLIERTSILREPIADRIDFTHRTFQEFFAAQAALDAMEIEQLVANAYNDQWREVVLLAAGLASQAQCEQLLSGLIERGDKKQAFRYQLHLLAVSCLDTAIELGPSVRAEVEKRLGQLIPPKNITEAKALACAGDLAVKYLAKKEEYSGTIGAACIRTLAIIAGDAALEMLKGYVSDTRETERNELVRAWDNFDKHTYAINILLPLFRDISMVHVTSLSSADKIHYLINLTGLTVLKVSVSTLKDLRPLANLPNLTTLSISTGESLSSVDLAPLASLPNLTTLSISTRGFSTSMDLAPLANLPNLTTLSISSKYSIGELKPLASLPNLSTLNLSGCTSVGFVSQLMDLNSLKELILPKGTKVLSSLTKRVNVSYV
jgi:NACHT domain